MGEEYPIGTPPSAWMRALAITLGVKSIRSEPLPSAAHAQIASSAHIGGGMKAGIYGAALVLLCLAGWWLFGDRIVSAMSVCGKQGTLETLESLLMENASEPLKLSVLSGHPKESLDFDQYDVDSKGLSIIFANVAQKRSDSVSTSCVVSASVVGEVKLLNKRTGSMLTAIAQDVSFPQAFDVIPGEDGITVRSSAGVFWSSLRFFALPQQ